MSEVRSLSGGPVKEHMLTRCSIKSPVGIPWGKSSAVWAHNWSPDRPLYTDARWWYVARCCDAILGANKFSLCGGGRVRVTGKGEGGGHVDALTYCGPERRREKRRS